MDERNGTVLIVGEDKGMRGLLHERLKDEGYNCEEAKDIDEALAYLRHSSTDLVLLDIGMPCASRLGLLPEIRERCSDVKVVVAIGNSDINTAIEYVSRGAYDYILKPLNLDDVAHNMRISMDRRRLELELRDYQQHLEQKVEEQTKEIRESLLGAMVVLSFALEAKDTYTAGHSRRVTDIAMAIGKRLSLNEDELNDLKWGSLLHDIGKIAVDELIVNKPGRLTGEEYEHVMTHPTVGASIVRSVVKNKGILEIIEHHHAHYGGGGFNQKLKGKDIPLLAGIVAVADAYDAMTSARPYRSALSREEALTEIRQGIGRQFDPTVADVFLQMSAADITPRKRKILIVDDEASIRLLVRSILGNNYTVIEAADGQEAVEAAQSQEPALILMDILMPRKDGLQACYEIKANLATKAIPVVMLTAIDFELDKKISADFGADGYITKPFTPQELLDVIARFLESPE